VQLLLLLASVRKLPQTVIFSLRQALLLCFTLLSRQVMARLKEHWLKEK